MTGNIFQKLVSRFHPTAEAVGFPARRRNENNGHITKMMEISKTEDVRKAIRWLQYDNIETPALSRKREKALFVLSEEYYPL